MYVAAHLQHCKVDPEEFELEVERIFKAAKAQRYTTKGEMFSADNMADLAKQVYNCNTRVLIGGNDASKQSRDRCWTYLFWSANSFSI